MYDFQTATRSLYKNGCDTFDQMVAAVATDLIVYA